MARASTWDTVIVGGGVIGSAVAYFLAASPDYNGSLLVLERDPSYVAGSTGLSAGGFRQQFSLPENIDMSHFSIDFMDRVVEFLSVGDQVPDIGMVRAGYLFLASPKGRAVLEENYALQRARRVAVTWLEPKPLAARFPWLNIEGVSAGTIGDNEGWLDAYSLMWAFRRKAESLGVVYRQAEARGLIRRGNRITGITCTNGEMLQAGRVIDAAGPYASQLAESIGLQLPVHPRKRYVYTFTCPETFDHFPMLVDCSGAYVRPEGSGFLCGISPPEDQDPDCLDLEVDDTLFMETIWPALAERVPAFERLRPGKAWAGHYAYNTVDQNAILGFHPEVANLLFANGFSGHGLQQAPAVGRALAELVIHGRYVTLDLSRLDFARFAENRLLMERNII
ncbi:MAG: FAD-binding oxidoreductase [Acidobacteriota bacterium]|nr:FAD-binding oxidoreductase [Acidobacteriota bacterium]